MSKTHTAPDAATAKQQPVTTSPSASVRRVSLAELGLPLAIILLVVGGGLTTTGFLTGDNLKAVLLNASITGIAAVAMTPVTLSGNYVSLATAQSAMLAAVVFVAEVGAGWPIALAILSTLVLLAVVGFAQGAIVAAGLNPVLTTLAAGAVIAGIVASLLSGQPVTLGNQSISWGVVGLFGVPTPIYIFILTTVALTLVVHRTVLGRQLILVGANRETAELTGIAAGRVTILAFVIFSVGLAIAGILWGAQLGTANSDTLSTLSIDAGAAVLVGGTAIQGGQGSPLRSAAGGLIIALATNIMILRGASFGERQAVVGAVIIAVVVALQILRRGSHA